MIWKPDICSKPSCEFEIETGFFDSVHASVQSKCQAHQEVPDSVLFDSVWSECKLKEEVREKVFKKNPSIVKVLTTQEKLQLELLKRGIGDYSPVPDEIYLKDPLGDFKWSFNAQRELEVDLSDFSPADKAIFQVDVAKVSSKIRVK